MLKTTQKLSICVLALASFVGVGFLLKPVLQKSTPPTLQNTSLLKTAQSIQAFSLTDTNHKTFNAKSFKGHWNILFFGYPKCPSICPATLRTITQVFEKFPTNRPVPVRFYFANIDLQDTDIEPLKTFLARFRPEFIGLNGDKPAVLNLMSALGIHAWEDGSTGTGIRKIGHSSQLLIINPQGRLKAIMSPPLDPDEIFQDLNQMIRLS